MDANLQPLVSCQLITPIIRQRKKVIEKIKKYSQIIQYKPQKGLC